MKHFEKTLIEERLRILERNKVSPSMNYVKMGYMYTQHIHFNWSMDNQLSQTKFRPLSLTGIITD